MKHTTIANLLFISLMSSACIELTTTATVEVSDPYDDANYEGEGRLNDGYYSDGVYTNPYFGFSVSPDDNWKVLKVEVDASYIQNPNRPKREEYWTDLVSLVSEDKSAYVKIYSEALSHSQNGYDLKSYMAQLEAKTTGKYKEGWPKYMNGNIVQDEISDRRFMVFTYAIKNQKGPQTICKIYCAQYDVQVLVLEARFQGLNGLHQTQDLLDDFSW